MIKIGSILHLDMNEQQYDYCFLMDINNEKIRPLSVVYDENAIAIGKWNYKPRDVSLITDIFV